MVLLVRRYRAWRVVRIPVQRGPGQDDLQGRTLQGLLPRAQDPPHVREDSLRAGVRGRGLVLNPSHVLKQCPILSLVFGQLSTVHEIPVLAQFKPRAFTAVKSLF